MKYEVWTCSVYINATAKIPKAFDKVPRKAVNNAIDSEGVEILGCFSGWGGKPKEIEVAVIENREPKYENMKKLLEEKQEEVKLLKDWIEKLI